MWAGPTLDGMDEKEAARAAVREFLTTRRARVTPTDAGLPPQGTRRRVKGLRREEVALLAGVSPEYYVRLERGQATGPSAGVVDAVAGVLRLDDDERAHLDRLLAALSPEARKRSRVAAKDPVTPGVRVLLDSLDHLPAVVFNGRLDLLAVNALGRALYAPVFDLPGRANSARFLFLDEPRARDLFPEWDRLAGDTVAILRIEAGRHPDDPELIELIGQLSTRSTAFRTRWAGGDVRAHRGGTKTFRHPLIGQVTLPYENLHVDAVSGQVLTVFTPQPGTSESDAIRLLASWNADDEQKVSHPAETGGRTPRRRPSRPPVVHRVALEITGAVGHGDQASTLGTGLRVGAAGAFVVVGLSSRQRGDGARDPRNPRRDPSRRREERPTESPGRRRVRSTWVNCTGPGRPAPPGAGRCPDPASLQMARGVRPHSLGRATIRTACGWWCPRSRACW